MSVSSELMLIAYHEAQFIITVDKISISLLVDFSTQFYLLLEVESIANSMVTWIVNSLVAYQTCPNV